MRVTVFDLVFYFKDTKEFKCDTPRRCPRYSLYKRFYIHHQQGLKMVDQVMDTMLEAAAKVFAVGEKDIVEQTEQGTWYAKVPTDARGLPVVAVPILSASQAHTLQETQKASAEDVMIAGWFSHKFLGKVCHIHYVQPKTLYYFSQTMKPFYRPYFVSAVENVIHVNMGPTSHSFIPVEDGIQELFKYFKDELLPPRPKALEGKKKSPCTGCVYDPFCHYVETRRETKLGVIAGLYLPAGKE